MNCRRLFWLMMFFALVGCSRQHAGIPDGHSGGSTVRSSAPGEIGSHLPEFDVNDLWGNQISSNGVRGKVVLVDIWATWCQPCRKEMPGYQKLLNRYGPQGFVVIGLKSNMMMDTQDPSRFAREIGVHYPLVSASSELIEKFCQLEGLPTTMIYDRQGILRKKVIGFDYAESFESTLKPLL